MVKATSGIGISLTRDKKYEEASEHFREAKSFFEKIGNIKNAIYCEGQMYESLAFLRKSKRDYEEGAKLFFVASEKFRNIKEISKSLLCEMHAWGCLGHNEMVNKNFLEAKKYFLLASAFAEVLGKDSIKNWYRAKYYECEYYYIKNVKEGSSKLQEIIDILEKVVKCYEQTEDMVGLHVAKGDLNKYKGYKSKVENKLDDAIKYFNDAKSYYEEAAKLDPKNAKRHESSAIYALAVAIETEALKAFICSNFKDAAKKFYDASEKYNQCEDFRSATLCGNLHKLCQALSTGDFAAASEILNQLSSSTSISGPIKDHLQFIRALMPIIQEHTAILIDFDNKFGIYPPGKIILRKYDEVEGKSFKPESDEVGIVFDNETPIDIDVLACRKERNRTYILLAECKHRPKYRVNVKDLDLLLKKSEFIKKRFSKIARLRGEFEPIIEEIWFITTGEFTEDAKSFAIRNNIRLINLNALNNLFKEFGLPRMK